MNEKMVVENYSEVKIGVLSCFYVWGISGYFVLVIFSVLRGSLFLFLVCVCVCVYI